METAETKKKRSESGKKRWLRPGYKEHFIQMQKENNHPWRIFRVK